MLITETNKTAAAKLYAVAAQQENADDRGSLEYIADEIKAGSIDGLLGYASSLDTYLRDEIPSSVLVHIGGRLVESSSFSRGFYIDLAPSV